MSEAFIFRKDNNGGYIEGPEQRPIVRLYNEKGKINGIIENGTALEMSLVPDVTEPNGVLSYKDSSGCFSITDRIHELSPEFIRIERTFINLSAQERDLVLLFECEAMFRPDFYMIPAVTYNGNRWGTGSEPKGLSKDGIPWVFAYNRSALPSSTFSESTDFSLGLFADDRNSQSLISSCSMEEGKNGMIHRLIWPDREEPFVYSGRDSYSPAATPEITLAPNGRYVVTFYLSLCQVDESGLRRKNFGWVKTFDRAHDLFHRDLPLAMDSKTFWRHRVEYIKDIQYVKKGPSGEYSLFEMGLLPNGHIYNYFPVKSELQNVSFQIRESRQHEIGWCGQNASEAVALLYDYVENSNEESLAIGLAVLDTWSKYAVLDCGLFRAEFDEIVFENGEVHIDTCNLGWGMWQMLEAWQVLKSLDINKPEYYDMSIRACDFFVSNRASDGSFGKTWTIDGKPDDEGGTIGCYILLGLSKAYELTKEQKYLDTTRELFRFYVERDLSRMECTAGALDTHCIDKETCWPLCKVGLDLFEYTGESEYLEDAMAAAYYMLSFMLHFNGIYDEDTDFSILGYQTYGGTSVSAQHHHLDPWGSLIAYDFYRLFRHTGEIKWKQRFHALWRNALLGVSDGNLVIHGLKRPASTQNEGFWHCRFTPGYDCKPGRFNDWLQSWPGAFKLISIIRARQDGLDAAALHDKIDL